MNRRWTRRRWIESAGAFTLGATLPGCKTKEGNLEPVVVRAAPVVTAKVLDSLLEDLQERTFNFFWDTAEPETGLIPDRWPRPPFSSIAAVGFALNAYVIDLLTAFRKASYDTATFTVEEVRPGIFVIEEQDHWRTYVDSRVKLVEDDFDTPRVPFDFPGRVEPERGPRRAAPLGLAIGSW